DGSLKKYLAQKDDLHAGRTLRPDPEGTTVKDLANHFLNQKKRAVDVGELSPRTWTDYKEACDLAVTAFGKNRLASDLAPEDFAKLRDQVAKQYGPHRLGKTIQCIRCLFKYGFEVGLIAVPARFGPGFKRPSKKTLRLHKAAQGPKLFTREEITRLLAAAGAPLRAMILLGVNCGFGNSDLGNLPSSALDLDAGWLDYPRPKTGIARRCPLWPEPVQAIRESLSKRPTPKEEADAGLVFITIRGQGWSKDKADSPVSKEFKKLLNALGINGHRN